MFCQAFEIQMTPSTRCPADGFESCREKRGAAAAEEQRGEARAVPKIDDSVEPEKDATSSQKGS